MNIGILFGRFAPPHLGHLKLVKQALSDNNELVYVVVIQGEKTGKDLVRNPLTFEMKQAVLSTMAPEVEIIREPTASLVATIISILNNIHATTTDFHFTVYTGSDRVVGYQKQASEKYIQWIKDETNHPEYNISIDVVPVARSEESEDVDGYSASKVRAAIRDGNDNLAMKMMGIEDIQLYKKIKDAVIAGLQKEAVEQKILAILEKI